MLLPVAAAFYPQQNNPLRPEFDYIVAYPQVSFYVVALYNDTDIYYDNTLNGIYALWTTLDKGDTSSLSTLPVSAKVHATKPIVAVDYSEYTTINNFEYPDDARAWGNNAVPAAGLLSDFYIPHPTETLYIIATRSNTNVLIDTQDDGTYELNTTISPGNLYSYASGTYPSGSRVKTDKPVGVKQRSQKTTADEMYETGFLVQDTRGTEFYIGAPAEGSTYFLALENATTIDVDVNNDGITDETYVLNKSDTMSLTSTSVTSFIQSDKDIIVSHDFYFNTGDYLDSELVYPAQTLTNSYLVANPLYSDVVVGSVEDNTDLLIDLENDGVWDTNTTIQSGIANSYTSVQPGSLIQSNKPLIAYMRSGRVAVGGAQEYWGHLLVSPSISITAEISPSPADYNTLATISSKIWNMNDKIYNFTVYGTVNEDFVPYPDTSKLNITVSKYYANDTQIGTSDYFQVQLNGTGPFSYSFNVSNSDVLDELDTDQYIEFTYRATSPSVKGTYVFDPVRVDIGRAPTYHYRWE